MVTSDPTEQAVALITAATVIIEQDVGRALAGATLCALIETTLAGWQAPTAADARH